MMTNRPRATALTIFVLTACLSRIIATRAIGAEPAAKPSAQDLIGQKVDIELASGKTVRGVEVAQLAPGKTTGAFLTITVLTPETEKRTTIGARAIKRVLSPAGNVLLVFDPATKALTAPGAAKPAGAEPPAGQERPAAPDKPSSVPSEGARRSSPPASRPSSKANARSRKTKGKPEEVLDPKEKEAKRQEFFKTTGVWLWPDLSDEQQKEELEKRKAFLKKVTEAFPALGMRLYETRYFLFQSDMPPAVAGMYALYLDEMYQKLSDAFAIPRDTNIFPGKAVIVAFARKEAWFQFEATFYKAVERDNATGLAHLDGHGTVVISSYCHTTPQELASVIVHETTHGFVHRYKSAQQLPTWLNEGLAEWVAATVVLRDDSVRHKQQAGVQSMRQQQNLGGNFFSTPNLDAWQYGAASLMTNFLIRSNPKAFRELIEQIKSGQKWEDALQKSYSLTPPELAVRFGLSAGVPGLGP